MRFMQSRRRFLTSLSLAGAAALVGAPKSLHAEPPPETTTVHLLNYGTIPCSAPVLQSVLGELLRAEGFTDVRYADWQSKDASGARIASGEVDFDYNFPAVHVAWIEAGVPIKVIAGAHSGCLEVLGNGSVHKIADLKGKKVGVDGDDPNDYTRVLVSLMAEDLCASQPKLVANRLVKSGFTDGYDYAFQSLTEVPFARWREFDSEDTLRFYALRMHEAGMITSSPRKIIADGADWRFINELKRELKG